MTSIEDRLQEVEAAGYDYRITRHTDHNGAHFGVDICYRGALDSISTAAHSYGGAAELSALPDAIASALQQQREKS